MALGWEEVDETELVRGQMVNVVLACIRRITTTKGDNLKDALATGGQVSLCVESVFVCFKQVILKYVHLDKSMVSFVM